MRLLVQRSLEDVARVNIGGIPALQGGPLATSREQILPSWSRAARQTAHRPSEPRVSRVVQQKCQSASEVTSVRV